MKEEFKNGTLFLGDARELIKELPDCSIDLIFTDPPYGVTNLPNDNPEVFFSLEDELWRVLKPNRWMAVWWAVKKLPEIFKLKKFTYCWQIIAYLPRSRTKCTFGDRNYTLCVVFSKGNPGVVRRASDVVYAVELPFVKGRINFPLFKPTAAICEIISMLSKEGDVVLDPFAGLCSIPAVCELFNRRWIAYEIDEKLFRAGANFIRTGEVNFNGFDDKQLMLFEG